jgi:hypothetical protein
LQNSFTTFSEKKETLDIDNKMKTGFDKFLHCLDLYMELLEYPTINDESRVTIYESVTLENGAITRATNNYHNKAWFSNVAISMDFDESDNYISDHGVCYGLVTEFIVNTKFLHSIFITRVYYL